MKPKEARARINPVAMLSRPMCINLALIAFSPKTEAVNTKFLFCIFKKKSPELLSEGIKSGSTVQSIQNGFFKNFHIPLPPIETQQQIVAEIEAEQALVAANRELIERFEKKNSSRHRPRLGR
jgi:type I restriction enzyme M protein